MTQDNVVETNEITVTKYQAAIGQAYNSLIEQGVEPSPKNLSRETGLQPRAVQKHLLYLRSIGYIAPTSLELTARERDTFEVLKTHIAQHGYVPTLKELAVLIGVKHPATVRDLLLGLKSKGYVTWQEGSGRSIRLLK